MAPMVGYTHPSFRHLMRLLSREAILYSEMIKTTDLLAAENKQEQLLARGAAGLQNVSGREVLQLGGDNIDDLQRCCRMARQFNYDEINLNCGCPSIETNAHFGASLMRDPQRVALLLEKMSSSCQPIPISIKCRIGVHEQRSQDMDYQDSYENLHKFVSVVAKHVSSIIIHARSAVLQGLDPEKNRSVPPLRYDYVEAIAREFPGVNIVLNGGISVVNDTMVARESRLGGVMVGRQLLRSPFDLLDSTTGKDNHYDLAGKEEAAERAMHHYARYATAELSRQSGSSSAIEVILPLVLLFQSLLIDEPGTISMSRLGVRQLKLVMQVMVPVLAIASSTSSLLALLKNVENELNVANDDDEERIIYSSNLMKKVVKEILGKKIMSKVKKNCQESSSGITVK